MRIEDPLPARIREILQKKLSRLKRLDKAQKRNIILGLSIFLAGTGMFFYPIAKKGAAAFFSEKKPSAIKEIEEIDPQIIDPLNRIGKGVVFEEKTGARACVEAEASEKKNDRIDPAIYAMVEGFPMEEMVPALSTRKKEVAAYLVAIAKKESNWGKHTPKKNGQECYNFWGYRGKENTTDSGYSCFDSPEHAVEVVGNRIERLIDQKIDTPAKMVVWKCGRDCEAAGGQAAANKWIADVASYYNKLNS